MSKIKEKQVTIELLKAENEALLKENEKVLIQNKKLKEEMGKNHKSFLIMADDCLKLQSENNKLKPENEMLIVNLKSLQEDIEKLISDEKETFRKYEIATKYNYNSGRNQKIK